jgi:hypothetical protein
MKRFFTFLIIVLFAANVSGYNNTTTDDLSVNSRIAKIIVDKAGMDDAITKFALERLLMIHNGSFILPETRAERQKMDSLVYYGELDLGGIGSPKTDHPALLTTFSYNADGRTSMEYFALWDTLTGTWAEDMLKISMSYNDDGMATEAVVAFNVGDDFWIDVLKAGFTYNGDETEEINITMIDMDTGGWVDLLKIDFTYADGNVSELMVTMYDGENDAWVDMAEVELSYNNLGFVNEVIVYYNDLDVKDWLYGLKITMNYEGDKLVSQVDYTWVEELANWVEQSKQEYTYDDLDNVTMLMTYIIDDDGAWMEAAKQTFQYNNDYSYSDLILPYQYMSDYIDNAFMRSFNHMMTKLESYSKPMPKEDWVKDVEVDFYYSPGDFSSVGEVGDDFAVNIFPNPAEDFLTVKYSSPDAYTFRMYDVTGKMVIERPVKNDDVISLEELNSGVYFYKLEKGDREITGKLVKK